MQIALSYVSWESRCSERGFNSVKVQKGAWATKWDIPRLSNKQDGWLVGTAVKSLQSIFQGPLILEKIIQQWNFYGKCWHGLSLNLCSHVEYKTLLKPCSYCSHTEIPLFPLPDLGKVYWGNYSANAFFREFALNKNSGGGGGREVEERKKNAAAQKRNKFISDPWQLAEEL